MLDEDSPKRLNKRKKKDKNKGKIRDKSKDEKYRKQSVNAEFGDALKK